MLMRNLLFVAIAAASASQIPALFGFLPEAGTADKPVVQQVSIETGQAAFQSGAMVMKADAQGHFKGSFRINGKVVDGLVDTGATFVALNETTARRLGFSGNGLDFRYAVSTANGPTEAAHVTLDRIEIGGIRVRNVEAFVLKDKSLKSTLVGMSFLKQLASFSVKDGELHLKQ